MKFEPLEPRTLMSFTFVLSNGTLTITGSDSTVATDADQIQITQNGSAITATDIRTGAAQTANSGVSNIVVDLRSGDDYVRLRNNDGTKPVILNSTIFGGLGNDTIYGGDVNDNLSGGDGDDKLQGRGGSDVYDGGAGFDTADYSYETRAISVSLDGLTNDGVINVGNGSSELDTVQNTIEAVVGGSGNDTLIGNASANLFDGGAGNDGMAGLEGNDTLTGGLGTDTVIGNGGNDFLFAKDGIADSLNAAGGTDSAQVDTTPKDVATTATTVSTPLAAVAMLRSLGASPVYASGGPQNNIPGAPELSFGTNGDGTVVEDFGLNGIHITKVLEQRIDLGDGYFDRKLLLIGYALNSSQYFDFFLGRLNADGSVDTTFGQDDGTETNTRTGYALTDMGINGAQTSDYANDAVIDTFGRIVLAGTSIDATGSSDFALVRYTSSGQLDLDFGGNSTTSLLDRPGTILRDFGYDDGIRAIVTDYLNDNLTYAVIGSSDGTSIVHRFDEFGEDDLSFAPIQVAQDGQQFAGVDLAQDSQGNYWALSKRTDQNFYGHALVIGYDHYGELLYGGSGSSAADFDYVESGYGNFDPSAIAIGNVYGTDSIVVVGTASSGSAGTLAQSFISIGTFNDQTTWNIDFQSKQTVPDPLDESISFVDVAFNGFSPEGKARIVVTGTESGNGPDQFYTGRFFNDLQGDVTFNYSGGGYQNYVLTQVGDSSNAAAVVTPDAIYVAGTVFNSNETTSAGVVKYNGGNMVILPPVVDAPPELDPTFGPDSNPAGTIKQVFGDTVTIEDVTTQIVGGQEKILLAGTIGQALQQNNGGAIDQFIARLNADGSLDNTFGWLLESGGRAGYYTVDFGSGFLDQRADYVNKIVVNPNNTITLLGTSYATDENNVQSDGEITIARLGQNGILDTSFGAFNGVGGRTGKNMIDIAPNSSEKTVDVVVQPITVGENSEYQYVVLSEGQFSGQSGGRTARWTYDGQPSFFNLSGYYDPSGNQNIIAAGADSGGNLWFLSQTYDGGEPHFTLNRTDSQGNPEGGAYIADPFGSFIGSEYTLTDMVIGPDNKVYFTANIDNLPQGRGGVITAQINGTGMTQTGSAIFSSPITDQGPDSVSFSEVTLDSDGKLLIAGRVNQNNDLMLFRTEAGGLTADLTYGDRGFAYYDNRGQFNSGPHIGGIAIQSDGLIVIGGDATNRLASGQDGLNALFAARFDPASQDLTNIENFLPDNFDPSTLVIDDPDNASNGQQLPGYLIVDLVPTVDAKPLTITGTSKDDSITVTQIVGQNGEPLVQVQVNTDVTTYDPASISEYIIDGFGGTDSINFSPAKHLPLTINGEDGFTLRIGSSSNELGQVTPITSVTSPNGAAQLFDNGTPDAADDYILYTPTNGSFGLDSFSYTVGAPQGAASQIALSADEITVSINVSNINDAPVAEADTLSNSDEDATRTILASELLGNDVAGASNESGQTIVITSVSNAVGGTVELLADGNVKFTPTPDYNGPASFDYTITDDGTTNGVADPKSASSTASFTITEVNDAPTATNDTPGNIAEDSGDYVIPSSDLLGNDSKGPLNESGQTLTITGVSNAVGGTVKIVGSTVVFTPTADYNGSAGFQYTVSDDGTTNGAPDFKTALGTASFTITEVNDAPTATNDPLSSVAEDSGSRTILASTLLGNDSKGPANESGQTLTITGVSNAVGGTVSLVSGNVVFIPTADYNGPASFDYTIADNGTTNGAPDAKSASGTASFTITEVNDAPTATNDTPGNIAEDSGDYVISFSDLLGNDSKGPINEAGQTLTITAVSNAVGGTVKIVGSTVVFTPTANYNGPASFKYTVSDNGTTNAVPDFKTALGTVSFSVTPVNDKPTAIPGGPYQVTAGQSIQLNGSATDVDLPSDVLTYSWDLDGDGIFGETGVSATRGNESGATPTFNSAGLPGSSTFSVSLKVTDSGNLSDTKSVSITINPDNSVTKLTGSFIGIAGTTGNGREKAFDGNINTYYESCQTNNAWVGLDLGVPKIITQIRFYPRAGRAKDMVGGMFQGSNDPTFGSGVTTFYSVGGVQPPYAYTSVNVSNPGVFRYVRYLGRGGVNATVAEIEFYGKAAPADNTGPTKPGTPVMQSNTFTSIKIGWASSTDTNGVTRYDVYRDGLLIGSTASTSFTDTGRKPGTSYAYKVQAFDPFGNPSAFSDTLTTSTLVDATPPSKPGKPKATNITRTSLTLSWTASTDNVAVVKYFIYQNGVKIGESTTPSFNVINLTRNTTYTYTVAALDISNNMSVLSDPLAVKTLN